MLFTAMTLGVALTMVPGCGNSANAVRTSKPQFDLISNDTMDSNPTSTNAVAPQPLPPTEVPPATHSSYPQRATKHLVPEIWSVPKGDVAITIDDGPSPYTEQIIQVLNRYHVHATFFFIGDRVPSWPNAVRDAIASGDVVGNHSESHPLLTDLPLSEQQAQIEQAQEELKQYGASPTLFRPPYGAFNDFTEQVLAKDHLTLALWNRDPRDWADNSPRQVIDSVINGEPSGGVFDLHDKLVTLEALPTIIETLQKRGLHFVVLGQKLPVYPEGSGSKLSSGSNSHGKNGSQSTNSIGGRSDGATNKIENSTETAGNTTRNAGG